MIIIIIILSILRWQIMKYKLITIQNITFHGENRTDYYKIPNNKFFIIVCIITYRTIHYY